MADWDDDVMEGGMIEIDPAGEVNRKVTPVFFLIDVSGSMSGSKIGTVNSAMREIMKDLKGLDSADFVLQYAVLSFGTECIWETGENNLVPCDGVWKQLDTNGLTYFNTACRMLKEKLSGKHGFFKFAAGKTITPPVLILLTDGFANDGDANGLDGIKELELNKYFKGSIKVAIAIGENANLELCENFTGDKETVWTSYNAKALSGIMKAVVNASIAVSSSGTSDANGAAQNPQEFAANQKAVKTAVDEEFKSNPDLTESANCVANKDIDWD